MRLNRLVIYVLLVSNILVSCEPPAPSISVTAVQTQETVQPASTEAPTENIPPSAPAETLAPVPTNSTVVEFLVDKSASVDKNCENNRRYDFVNFMVKSLKDWTRFPNSEKLYIGAAQFGSNFDPSLQPTDITTLNRFDLVPDQSGTDDTLFATGITQAVTQMRASNAKKRILVILTDGEFETDKVGDVESELLKTVNKDLMVYIGLLCPNLDSLKSFAQDWHNKFDNKLIGVRVFDSAEKTGVEVLKQLQRDNFLSSDFTPLIISNADSTAVVPGYATTATFSYWSMSDQPLNVDLNDTQFVTLLSSKPERKDIDPKSDCGDFEFQINPLNSPANGLLLVTFDKFKNIDLSITLVSATDEIINNSPVVVKVTAKDLDTVDKFGSWRYCYSLGIDTPNLPGSSFTLQECEPGLFKCLWDGTNSFYSEWNWKPPAFGHAKVVMVEANLTIPKYNITSSDSNLNVPVEFQATYSGPNPLAYQKNGDFPGSAAVEIVTGKITFGYVASDPQIYLLSLNKIEKMKSITDTLTLSNPNIPWLACPTPSLDPNVIPAGTSGVDLTDYKQRKKSLLSDVYAIVFPQPEGTNPLLPTDYIFKEYSYVLSDCGYSQIEFRWSAQAGVKASAWMCGIVNDIISCNPDSTSQ